MHKLDIFGNTESWGNTLMQDNIVHLIYVRLTLCLHTSMLREAYVGQPEICSSYCFHWHGIALPFFIGTLIILYNWARDFFVYFLSSFVKSRTATIHFCFIAALQNPKNFSKTLTEEIKQMLIHCKLNGAVASLWNILTRKRWASDQ